MPKPGPHSLAGRTVGRYALHAEIASGGMAVVHLGRMRGAAGFSKTVAVKRMHPHLADDPELVSMLTDEARLVSRITHPNVVTTLDVVEDSGEVLIVMEYVHGESLARLLGALWRQGKTAPIPIATTLFSSVLHGLHAAHEAKDERGRPLNIVHRDISPQNILVGADGVARVLDFGVAKASGRVQTTREGSLKGKIAYMAPEQLSGAPVSRRTDVYATGIVLWEVVTGKRLFQAENDAVLVTRLLAGELRVPPPSTFNPEVPRELDALLMCALSRDPSQRFASAREMALALERFEMVPASRIGSWVEQLAGQELARRAESIRAIEAPAPSLTTTLPLSSRLPLPVEPATQAGTSISNLPEERARRRTSWVLLLVASAFVCVAGLAVYRHVSLAPKVDAAAALPAATVSVDPAPTSPSLPDPSPIEENDLAAPASAASPSPTAKPAEPAAKRAGQKRVDCKVPYEIDEQGHKIYKRACLH